MALTDVSETDKKPVESKNFDNKKEKLLTKVIIRRLPPNMDHETFLNQISPVPNYDYFYMVKGDASLGEHSFARAYINFSNPTDIYDFKEKFDNYVFLDNAGHEYPAVVEFAAFQKVPKKRNKIRVDPKVGTIESDQCYLDFVEMINKPPEQDEKPEYSYQITTESKVTETSTPLLEYVKNKRAEKLRIREERREERKRKEFERKRFRDDDRKKRYEERSPAKNKTHYTKVASPKEIKIVETDESEKKTKPTEGAKLAEKEGENKVEKPSTTTTYYNKKDRKYEDRSNKKDSKTKYPPKKDYTDKREYKSRREEYKDYRPKYDEYKKDDSKVYQKKVKKYSEKREERKLEAQKTEQKKLEQQFKDQEAPAKIEETPKAASDKSQENQQNEDKTSQKSTTPKDSPTKSKSKDETQRRIRNKDRPTIAIYRPGMLSKRKQTDGEPEHKENRKE